MAVTMELLWLSFAEQARHTLTLLYCKRRGEKACLPQFTLKKPPPDYCT